MKNCKSCRSIKSEIRNFKKCNIILKNNKYVTARRTNHHNHEDHTSHTLLLTSLARNFKLPPTFFTNLKIFVLCLYDYVCVCMHISVYIYYMRVCVCEGGVAQYLMVTTDFVFKKSSCF